jgi:hypothetical protein
MTRQKMPCQMCTNDNYIITKLMSAKALLQAILLTILCFATRVPQLVSPNLILDGDECVVAIMAKHIMQGKDFPIFFYGQNYGFSLIEVLFIIPFYWVLGISTLAVKLAMLTLWTVGVVFFYKLLTTISSKNPWLPFLITLLLIFTPAWAVWSMKARGGYLTAFTLSSVLLYLLFHKGYCKKWITYAFCGLLIIIIYQSQSLWIYAIAAIGLYKVLFQKNIKNTIVLALSILVFNIIFNQLRDGIILYYLPSITAPTADNILSYLARIPLYIFNNIQGHYYFREIQQPNMFCALFAYVFTTVSLLLPIAAFVLFVSRKWRYLPFILSAIGILPLLAATMWRPSMEPRYLLPLSGTVLLSIFFLLKDKNIKLSLPILIPYITVIIIGAIALTGFHRFSFIQYREKSFTQAIQYLQSKGVGHAFCHNGMVGWQFIFYSDEQLLCREGTLMGRYPEYYKIINNAYHSGRKTAVISDTPDFNGLQFNNHEQVNGFYLSIDPPKNEITKQYQF